MDVASYLQGGALCTPCFPVRRFPDSRGFTLVELLVVVAVGILLFGFAVPAFSSFLHREQQVTAINALLSGLYLARSEAVMRRSDVMLCKSNDGEHCTRNGEWDQGWLLFEDRNGDRTLNVSEKVITVHTALPNVNIYYRAFGSNHYIVYKSNGITDTNGTFTFCEPSGEVLPRAIVLHKTGRPRRSETRSDGSPLKCPP